MNKKLIRKANKKLKNCKPKRFEPGRSNDPAERCRRKGFQSHEILTPKKIGCNNATKEERALHKNLSHLPNYEGIGDARGSCPRENRQYVYLCLEP